MTHCEQRQIILKVTVCQIRHKINGKKEKYY